MLTLQERADEAAASAEEALTEAFEDKAYGIDVGLAEILAEEQLTVGVGLNDSPEQLTARVSEALLRGADVGRQATLVASQIVEDVFGTWWMRHCTTRG
jgi:hypothetical protein